MKTSGSFKNPMPLYNLLRQDIRQALNNTIILAEDLYFRDVLIIKAGSFLDEETIFRLLNFGLKKARVVLPESKEKKKPVIENMSILQLKKQYLGQQKCLVADKDGYFINEIINGLKSSYIKEENIYAVNNSIPIKNIIEDKNPGYLFIDLNLYPSHGLQIIKDIRRSTLANIFLTALVDENKTTLMKKLAKEVDSLNSTLILKPVSAVELRVQLLNTVTNDHIKYYVSQKRIKNKFKIA